MLLLFPGLRLVSRIALENAIILMLGRGGAKRGVVEIDHPERGLNVLFELVQPFQLLGSRGNSLPARRFEKHLVSAVQKNRDFGSLQHAGSFHSRLVLSFVTHDRADAVLCNLHPAIRQRFGCEACGFQQINALGEGWDLWLRLPKEHAFSIEMRGA